MNSDNECQDCSNKDSEIDSLEHQVSECEKELSGCRDEVTAAKGELDELTESYDTTFSCFESEIATRCKLQRRVHELELENMDEDSDRVAHTFDEVFDLLSDGMFSYQVRTFSNISEGIEEVALEHIIELAQDMFDDCRETCKDPQTFDDAIHQHVNNSINPKETASVVILLILATTYYGDRSKIRTIKLDIKRFAENSAVVINAVRKFLQHGRVGNRCQYTIINLYPPLLSGSVPRLTRFTMRENDRVDYAVFTSEALMYMIKNDMPLLEKVGFDRIGDENDKGYVKVRKEINRRKLTKGKEGV